MQQSHHVILEQLVSSVPVRPQGHHFQQLQGFLGGKLFDQFEHLHCLIHRQHVLLASAVLPPQLSRPLTC